MPRNAVVFLESHGFPAEVHGATTVEVRRAGELPQFLVREWVVEGDLIRIDLGLLPEHADVLLQDPIGLASSLPEISFSVGSEVVTFAPSPVGISSVELSGGIHLNCSESDSIRARAHFTPSAEPGVAGIF